MKEMTHAISCPFAGATATDQHDVHAHWEI